jgi:N-acetylmuramoyl-L-alanine amidase
MKRIKVALCPGHYFLSKGARIAGIIEHDEAIIIVDELYEYLNDYDFCNSDFVTGTLKEKVQKINDKKFDLAIDVHLNSVSASHVRGTETLHSGSDNSILLAEKIQNELVACLELPNRGVKKGYYRGDKNNQLLYFLRKTVCPAVIAEPLFMSNEFDVECLNHKMIAQCLGLGVISYIRELEY